MCTFDPSPNSNDLRLIKNALCNHVINEMKGEESSFEGRTLTFAICRVYVLGSSECFRYL